MKNGAIFHKEALINSRGFTLLELVMIIVLVSVLSVSAFMLWPKGMDEAAAVREFIRAVRFAQHLAMTRQYLDSSLQPDPWGITINSNQYTIKRRSGAVAVDPASSKEYSDKSLPGNTSISCTVKSIWFDRFGTPVDSSGTALSSPVVCSIGSTQVTIYPETGYVE